MEQQNIRHLTVSLLCTVLARMTSLCFPPVLLQFGQWEEEGKWQQEYSTNSDVSEGSSEHEVEEVYERSGVNFFSCMHFGCACTILSMQARLQAFLIYGCVLQVHNSSYYENRSVNESFNSCDYNSAARSILARLPCEQCTTSSYRRRHARRKCFVDQKELYHYVSSLVLPTPSTLPTPSMGRFLLPIPSHTPHPSSFIQRSCDGSHCQSNSCYESGQSEEDEDACKQREAAVAASAAAHKEQFRLRCRFACTKGRAHACGWLFEEVVQNYEGQERAWVG